MNNMFSLQYQVSSARQLSDIAKLIQHESEEKAVKRRGIEAQIESSKILTKQREELEVMRATINKLLEHNLERAQLQFQAAQERDQTESERYIENLRFNKIASWTGVVGTIFAVFGIILQFVL